MAQPSLDRQASFWNARAADYPDPREPAERARARQRMGRWPVAALPAADRRVLDVGAGTGALSLQAVEAGAQVTAFDVSSAMLERLARTIAPRPVQVVQGDWRHVDIDALGWRGAFDLVAAQMVPSLREPADFARMAACSRAWCVFVGWGRERHAPWLEAAFASHGASWQVPPGVPLAAECLRTLGLEPAPCYWFETWDRTMSRDAALRDAADHLAVRGVQADPALLEAALAPFTSGDGVVERCEVELGLLAWQPA